jgi:hypothetical protein
MTDKLGYADSTGFGNLTTLKEISSNNNKPNQKPTRIIRISEYTYRRLISHSQKFYDVVSYNEIIENLLNEFEKHNQDLSWRDIV